MRDDQFTKLFAYMRERFDKIESTMATREELERIYNLLDERIKQRETDEQERIAMNNQLDRHKGWITQIAKGTKIKLSPLP